MKTMSRFLVLAAALALLLTGCAKAPDAELTAARASVAAAASAGADIYAPSELGKVKGDLSAVEKEIATQNEKFFKNFDAAKQMISKADADAKAVAALVPERKKAAMDEAVAAEGAAKAALENAQALLAKAPKGKGTRADIEAFKADLAGVEQALPEVADMIAAEKYFGARDKANALAAKANDVSAQVEAAIAKTKKK